MHLHNDLPATITNAPAPDGAVLDPEQVANFDSVCQAFKAYRGTPEYAEFVCNEARLIRAQARALNRQRRGVAQFLPLFDADEIESRPVVAAASVGQLDELMAQGDRLETRP